VSPLKGYDFDPRNLPQDLLAAIGLAIASGSQTEMVMSLAIGGCLGVDAEYAMAVTTHMTLPLKFSVLRSVAEIRIDSLDDLDELDRLLENIDKALGKRHAVAHDRWCRDPSDNKLLRVKQVARTRLEGDVIAVTAKDILGDASLIYQAGMDLLSFIRSRNLAPHIPPLRPRAHKSKALRKKRRQK
jgi:hypothetical protein